MLVLLFIPIIPYEMEVSKGVVIIEYQPLIDYVTDHYVQGK
jgi:hypothetical protein